MFWLDRWQPAAYSRAHVFEPIRPRKPSSSWSAVNIAKLEHSQAATRMAQAGLAAFALCKVDKSAIHSHQQAAVAELPAELQRALQRNKFARGAFRSPRHPAIARACCTR